MAAKEKKPEKDKKNNGQKKALVTCERTYVSDRYFRNAQQQEVQRSPTTSLESIQVLDVSCKHYRRGAVQDTKRDVSLKKPRPAHQRADNAYVETTFWADDATATTTAATRATTKATTTTTKTTPMATTKTTPMVTTKSTTMAITKATNKAITKATNKATTKATTKANNTASSTSSSAMTASTCTVSTSAASTSAASTSTASTSTDSMLPLDEAPPRFGAGIIDEYPAYVPWKATEAREVSECNICSKCRCTVCQRLCRYPGMRLCGILDVKPRYHEDTVKLLTVCFPCIWRTPRCPAADEARANGVAGSSGPAATPEDSEARPARNAPSSKCRLRWLLCCLCIPCLCCTSERSDIDCVAGCRGNSVVCNCKCVDWDGMKTNKRMRGKYSVGSVIVYRERRRCRDDHYYRQYRAAQQRFPEDEPVSCGFLQETVETAQTVEKKSKLRKFLRF